MTDIRFISPVCICNVCNLLIMLIHFPISASQIGTGVIVCLHSQHRDKKCKTIWGTWLIFISPAYLGQPEPRTCVTWPQAANQRPGLRSRGRSLTNTGPDNSVQFPVTFIPLFLSPPHSRVGRRGDRRTFAVCSPPNSPWSLLLVARKIRISTHWHIFGQNHEKVLAPLHNDMTTELQRGDSVHVYLKCQKN